MGASVTTADPDYRAGLRRLGGWLAVATGAAIPVSTAITSVLLGLTVLCGIASGIYWREWRGLLFNPLTLSALALFAWLALGLAYTSAPGDQALRTLMKYRDLLYIPLLLPFFTDARMRRAAVLAFVGINLFILTVSWGDSLWQIVTTGALQQDAEVFQKRITQGLFLAFSAYWLYLHGQERPDRALPVAALLVLIAINLFFLVSGRTGQLIFLALVGLALFHRFHWRGLVISLAGGLILVMLAFSASDLFRARLVESFDDMQNFSDSDFNSSTAVRLSFYPNSLEIIGESPLIGHGIGSFAGKYEQQVEGSRYPMTGNPHNNFLLFGAEGGFIAVLLFIQLLARQWWLGRGLSEQDYRLLQGFLLLVLLDSVLNSFMRDSNEGHFYAYFSALLYAPLLSMNQTPKQD